MYVPRAMYSLRMSFCTVPESFARAIPRSFGDDDVHREQRRRRRVDRHRRRHLVERNLGEQRVHVVDRVDRDAHAADLAQRARRVGVEAHLRGEIEGDGEPGLPGGEQRPEARVRLARGAEARVLAHRPQPSAIHRRLHAARERKASGIVQVARVVDRRIFRTIERFEWNAGGGGAGIVARGHQRLRVIPRRPR